MVLTDGKESTTQRPFIRDVHQESLDNDVIVHSILYAMSSQTDHDLPTLADDTNGNKVLIQGDDQTALYEAFKVVFECDPLKPGEICSNVTQVIYKYKQLPHQNHIHTCKCSSREMIRRLFMRPLRSSLSVIL